MPKIKLLPPAEARKIAAGEVIERPAHVIKELIENAIDAQATTIALYLTKAGKTHIRLVDNGCGMEPADARTCFLPHATSKITALNDLETVSTYGFRGEALASIAAISKVTLTTKRNVDQLGIKIQYTEDQLTAEEHVACPTGTELIIDDLFYNTPARKKFLKQDDTEWHAIQQVFYAFCFSHTTIHFKLYHQDKLQLNAPPVATAKDRAAQIWGPDIASAFIPLSSDAQHADVHLAGFITNHQFWRYGKTHVHFFVNNRWVKNSELSKALFKGYLGVLPPERFPGGLIFFSVNQAEIDVNIHPKKEEVRFSKPGTIATALTNAVKATLNASVSERLDPSRQEQVFVPAIKPLPILPLQPEQRWPLLADGVVMPDVFDLEPPQPVLRQAPAVLHHQQIIMTPPHAASEQPAAAINAPSYRVLGQLMETYILCAHNNELVIVDQHAAHERILYEQRTHYFDQAQGTLLLFPEIVSLPADLVALLITWSSFFAEQGINFDAIGTTEIAVRSAPPQLRGPSLQTILTDAAHFIDEHGTLDRAIFSTKFNEHLHSHMACKAAVKAGDQLTMLAMEQLIKDLMTVDNRFICIHGRPTIWSMSKQELERKFRRG